MKYEKLSKEALNNKIIEQVTFSKKELDNFLDSI